MSTLIKESAADAIIVIDALSRKYADARTLLAKRVQAYKDGAEELVRKHLSGIKEAAARVNEREAELTAQVQSRPDLFVKPRTMTLHGVKVGLKKGAGKIEWDDAEKVVERIRAQFTSAEASLLLSVETVPNKDALLKLDGKALKKLGCRIVGTEDAPVVKDAAGDVDKFVEQLLKDVAAKETK